jgi:hypothetical protein
MKNFFIIIFLNIKKVSIKINFLIVKLILVLTYFIIIPACFCVYKFSVSKEKNIAWQTPKKNSFKIGSKY